MNSVALTLLEATLTLYAADPTGAPITSNPIWTGVDADYVQISDRWLKVETRPTGVKFPRRHPLVPQYEISIARVWALPVSDLVGFRPVRGNYVLDVLWTDEDTGDWHREVFYGVTISERSRGSRQLDSNAGEFQENQVFDAQEMVPSSGQGTPAVINADLPYTVRYVGFDGNATNIYNYDPATQTFSAIGDPSGKAVLVSDTTSFRVTFAGSTAAELEVSAAGLACTEMRTGAPTATDVPRVDFYYGTSRIGSVTRWGEVFAQEFFEGVVNPQSRPGVFQLFSGSALVGTIEQARFTANTFNAFTPAAVPNLKLWCSLESFAATPDQTRIAKWPDLSGNGNDLVQTNPANQPLFSRAVIDPVSGLAMDGLPGVFFDADQTKFLKTLGNVLATRQFTVFLLTWGGQDKGDIKLSTVGDVNNLTDYDFLLYDFEVEVTIFGKLTHQHHISGYYQTAGATANDNPGTSPMTIQQWNIMEWQLTQPDKNFSGTLNGVQNWSGPLTGSTASAAGADDRPIFLGQTPDGTLQSDDESLTGYVRALLVYSTPPSDADKDKIRKYLALFYSNNLANGGGRDVTTP